MAVQIIYRGMFMIRVLLPLAIAAAAYFGPWMVDTTGSILSDAYQAAAADGVAFAGSTAECAKDLKISLNGECEPEYGILGKLVAGTVLLSIVSAVLSIVGLVPLVGRLTSIVTVITGAMAIVTVAWFGKELLAVDGAVITDLRWGAYATGVFGLLTVFAGMAGMRGDG